ncbi:MAG: hypothetical protein M1831_007506 [Alyxoria varia]|nr:MAG: hypothetical protein M1831_007506 [Alyxoria varia]
MVRDVDNESKSKKQMLRRSLDAVTFRQQKNLPSTPQYPPEATTTRSNEPKQATEPPVRDALSENHSTRPSGQDPRYVRPSVPPKDPYPTPEPTQQHRNGPQQNAEYLNAKEMPIRPRHAPTEPRRINEPAPLGPRKMPPQTGGEDSWARHVSVRDDLNHSSASSVGYARGEPLESSMFGRDRNARMISGEGDGKSKQANDYKSELESGNRASQSRSQAPASGLDSMVDLRNTVDTITTSHVAPAVTHEHVQQKTINVKHERIVRHIHQDSVYHRILPIVDVEVTPPRHFVPSADGKKLVQISSEDVPEGRLSEDMLPHNWSIVENVSRTGNAAMQPRGFTAKKFPGGEGDDKVYRTEEGYPRRETTWVHPPQLETKTEHTTPFYFDHATGHAGWETPEGINSVTP